MAIQNRQHVPEAKRSSRLLSCPRVVAAVTARVFWLACVGVLPACSGGAEDLELTVAVDGDTVTVSWDGRAVHVVDFFLEDSGVWGISTVEEPFLEPRHEPTLLPPLRYGQEVQNAVILFGPEPLVRGATYRVSVDVLGWDEICEEHGIDISEEGFNDPSSDCSIAVGRASFTF